MKINRKITSIYCLFQISLNLMFSNQVYAGKVTYVEVDGKKIPFVQMLCPFNPETGQRYDEPWCNPKIGESGSIATLFTEQPSFSGNTGHPGTVFGQSGAPANLGTFGEAAQAASLALGVLAVHTQQDAITKARQVEMMQQSYSDLSAQWDQHDSRFSDMRADIQRRSAKLQQDFKSMQRSCESAKEGLCDLESLLDGIQVGTNNSPPHGQAKAPAQRVQDPIAKNAILEAVTLAKANEAQVNFNVNQAEELLQAVTPQMEQAAADYVREQIRSSQSNARNAVELAQSGASIHVVQLLGEFSINTVASIGKFLGGFCAGNYQGFLSAAQVAEAIYSDPTLILNLSSHIMNTITAGPGATADAIHQAFQQVSQAVYRFEYTMAYGNAEQRGFAVGEFGANVLLAMAGGEASSVAKSTIEGIAAKVTEASASDALGNAVYNGIRTSEALAPEVAAIDATVKKVGDSARSEGFTRVLFPRGAGAARGAVPEGYVRVSRWTSEAEAQVWMREGATAIPAEIGANQRLYVTTQGAPRPGGTGPVRIDFEVPERMLQGAGNAEWRQVVQPQANTPIYNVQINMP